MYDGHLFQRVDISLTHRWFVFVSPDGNMSTSRIELHVESLYQAQLNIPKSGLERINCPTTRETHSDKKHTIVS